MALAFLSKIHREFGILSNGIKIRKKSITLNMLKDFILLKLETKNVKLTDKYHLFILNEFVDFFNTF